MIYYFCHKFNTVHRTGNVKFRLIPLLLRFQLLASRDASLIAQTQHKDYLSNNPGPLTKNPPDRLLTHPGDSTTLPYHALYQIKMR